MLAFLKNISIGIKFLTIGLISMHFLFIAFPASAEDVQDNKEYSIAEIVEAGEKFFGKTSEKLGKIVEKIFSSYGLPNGYILGEEFSGAWIIGLTYGEGTFHTKSIGQYPVFWQGPSFGLDFGGQGSQVMMLTYDIKSVQDLYQRFGGVSGSAFVVAGLGFNVLKSGNQLIVPIRTGVGVKLGLNVGYLNITSQPTWNPF